jgi:hypothetical protein
MSLNVNVCAECRESVIASTLCIKKTFHSDRASQVRNSLEGEVQIYLSKDIVDFRDKESHNFFVELHVVSGV